MKLHIIAVIIANVLIYLAFRGLSRRPRRFFNRGRYKANALGFLSLILMILPTVFLIIGDKEYQVWAVSVIVGFILLLVGLSPKKEAL